MKGIIRKQLKAFSPQEQLNVLELIRCLLKSIEKSRSDLSTLKKELYEKSISTLECWSAESQDKKESLEKILEALRLEWI